VELCKKSYTPPIKNYRKWDKGADLGVHLVPLIKSQPLYPLTIIF